MHLVIREGTGQRFVQLADGVPFAVVAEGSSRLAYVTPLSFGEVDTEKASVAAWARLTVIRTTFDDAMDPEELARGDATIISPGDSLYFSDASSGTVIIEACAGAAPDKEMNEVAAAGAKRKDAEEEEASASTEAKKARNEAGAAETARPSPPLVGTGAGTAARPTQKMRLVYLDNMIESAKVQSFVVENGATPFPSELPGLEPESFVDVALHLDPLRFAAESSPSTRSLPAEKRKGIDEFVASVSKERDRVCAPLREKAEALLAEAETVVVVLGRKKLQEQVLALRAAGIWSPGPPGSSSSASSSSARSRWLFVPEGFIEEGLRENWSGQEFAKRVSLASADFSLELAQSQEDRLGLLSGQMKERLYPKREQLRNGGPGAAAEADVEAYLTIFSLLFDLGELARGNSSSLVAWAKQRRLEEVAALFSGAAAGDGGGGWICGGGGGVAGELQPVSSHSSAAAAAAAAPSAAAAAPPLPAVAATAAPAAAAAAVPVSLPKVAILKDVAPQHRRAGFGDQWSLPPAAQAAEAAAADSGDDEAAWAELERARERCRSFATWLFVPPRALPPPKPPRPPRLSWARGPNDPFSRPYAERPVEDYGLVHETKKKWAAGFLDGTHVAVSVGDDDDNGPPQPKITVIAQLSRQLDFLELRKLFGGEIWKGKTATLLHFELKDRDALDFAASIGPETVFVAPQLGLLASTRPVFEPSSSSESKSPTALAEAHAAISKLRGKPVQPVEKKEGEEERGEEQAEEAAVARGTSESLKSPDYWAGVADGAASVYATEVSGLLQVELQSVSGRNGTALLRAFSAANGGATDRGGERLRLAGAPAVRFLRKMKDRCVSKRQLIRIALKAVDEELPTKDAQALLWECRKTGA